MGDGVTVGACVVDVDEGMVWEGGKVVAVGVRDDNVLEGVDVIACSGAANTERLPIMTSRQAIITRTGLVVNLFIDRFS